MENPINNRVIVTEDIFMKAALDYCRRLNMEPFVKSGYSGDWDTNANRARNELADLAEQINALKSVGAI